MNLHLRLKGSVLQYVAASRGPTVEQIVHKFIKSLEAREKFPLKPFSFFFDLLS